MNFTSGERCSVGEEKFYLLSATTMGPSDRLMPNLGGDRFGLQKFIRLKSFAFDSKTAQDASAAENPSKLPLKALCGILKNDSVCNR